MKPHTVELPSRLDFESSLSFVEQLRKLPEAEEYCFDFKNLRWVEPFGLLFVANAINYSVPRCQDHERAKLSSVSGCR